MHIGTLPQKALQAIRTRPFSAFLTIAIICAFYFLYRLFPITGDDWAWGSRIGVDRLQSWFADYNGRYLGNLMVLGLTRLGGMRSVVMATLMIAVFLVMARLVSRSSFSAVWMCAFSVLAMPSLIFRQTVSWTSGFANYVISILAVLVFLLMARTVLRDPEKDLSTGWLVVWGVFLFLSQLFVEHVTIYLAVASLFLFGYVWRRRGNPTRLASAQVIGTLTGAIAMLANGTYFRIFFSPNSGRHQTAGGGAEGLVHDVFTKVTKTLLPTVFQGWFLAGLFLIAIVVFLSVDRSMSRRGRVLAALGTVPYCAYVLLRSAGPRDMVSLPHVLDAVGMCLMAVALIASVPLLTAMFRRGVANSFDILLAASSIVLVLPFIIVSPFAPRCMIASYVLLVILCSRILIKMMGPVVPRLSGPVLQNIGQALVVAALLFYVPAFMVIHSVDVERTEQAREAAGQGMKKISLPRLPNGSLVFMSDPADDLWNGRYRTYYGIPKSVEVRFIPYDDWKKSN